MKRFIRIVLATLNIIVAVCLLLSYLCCFTNPKTIWWLSFFGLGHIYLLIANLLFTVLWLFTKYKKLSLLSLVTILLGWSMIGRNIQISDKKTPDEKLDNSLKVISYNVHAFEDRDLKQVGSKYQNMFDFLRKNEADLICMQEYATSPWVKELKEENIRKHLNKTPYCHIEQTIGTIGIATFSKYPIIRKQLIYSDNSTNACMYSDLKIGQDTVRVFNVHLKSIGFSNEERQLLNNAVKKDYSEADIGTVKAIIRQMTASSFRRAKQVELVSKHIEQSPYPVIICGDFNDPPNSYSYQKIRGKRKDAFIEAGKGRSTTYNIGRLSSQRIDFILHSNTFRAYDYESPRVRYSDHFPVMCSLVKSEDK